MKTILVIFAFVTGLGVYNVRNSYAVSADRETVCCMASNDENCACSCMDCAEGKATCETCPNCSSQYGAISSLETSCCEAEAGTECQADCEKECTEDEEVCAFCTSCCG